MRQMQTTGTREEQKHCLLAPHEVCLQKSMPIVQATFEHIQVEALGESESVTA